MSYYYKYTKYKHKYNHLKKEIDDDSAQKLMKKSIGKITNSPNKSSIFLDIDLTNEEKNIISSPEVNINSVNSRLNYIGLNNYDILLKQLIDYLSQFYNNNIIVSKIIINKIIKPFVKAMDDKSLWFEMRFMNITSSYDIPRWHQDGHIVPSETNQKNIGVRLIGTLFGPGTLFKIYDKEMINEFLTIQKKLSEELLLPKNQMDYSNIMNIYRKNIDEKLQKYPDVQLKNGQVAVFITAPENKAAIHSEPKVDRPRLIFSITTGDESYMKEFAEMTEQKFYDK